MSQSAVIYTRISDDKEGRELGVDRQEEDCRALAEREGLNIVDIYSDNDISASTISRKQRRDWTRMLADAESGRFEVILAYSSSRLTRRPSEREDIIELHLDRGVRPLFANGSRPDLSTADGRQIFRLLGTVDTAEPERTSELARRKQKQLAESGRHNGPRPYGWDIHGTKADQQLTINDAEAEVVRECVDRVLRSEGLWRIRNDLNARGITTSTGKLWQTQTLRRMLLRWSNCGLRSHQPRDRHGKAKGDAKLYPAQWPPIIDRETHERVVAKLTDPTRRSNNRGTDAKYLLTGIALCGVCGGRLVGTNAFTYKVKGYKRKDQKEAPVKIRNYPHSYRCAHHGCMKVTRPMATVDEAVEQAVVVGLLERDGLRVLAGDPDDAERARARLEALEAKLNLTADQFADDRITAEQMTRINAKVRPQVDAERQRLARAMPDQSLAQFASENAGAAWEAANVEKKRTVLRALEDMAGLRITVVPIGPGRAGLDTGVLIDWEGKTT